MSVQKWQTVIKGFVTSQFGYCPLVWVFRSRGLNSKLKFFG